MFTERFIDLAPPRGLREAERRRCCRLFNRGLWPPHLWRGLYPFGKRPPGPLNLSRREAGTIALGDSSSRRLVGRPNSAPPGNEIAKARENLPRMPHRNGTR